MPRRNEKDLDEVPNETRKKLKIVLVDTIEEVFAEALIAKSTPRARK